MDHEYNYVLRRCPLFKDIDIGDYQNILDLLHYSIRRYGKNDTVLHFEDPVAYAGIIVKGSVEGTFLNEDFNEVSMNRFNEGMMFGEALCISNTQSSPMEVRCLEETAIIFVDLNVLIENNDNDLARVLNHNLLHIIAAKNVFLNLKVRLLSQKTLRNKILMYLSSLPKNDEGYHILNLSQTAMASFLNANRSALARELGKMEDDKIITTRKKMIKINI